MKLGAHAYYIVAITTTYFNNENGLRHLLLHSTNLIMVALMEMELGMHA